MGTCRVVGLVFLSLIFFAGGAALFVISFTVYPVGNIDYYAGDCNVTAIQDQDVKATTGDKYRAIFAVKVSPNAAVVDKLKETDNRVAIATKFGTSGYRKTKSEQTADKEKYPIGTRTPCYFPSDAVDFPTKESKAGKLIYFEYTKTEHDKLRKIWMACIISACLAIFIGITIIVTIIVCGVRNKM